MITNNKKAGIENQEAIVRAVDEAIKEKLLEGFFKIHRAEVIGMCLEAVSEEELKRIWHRDGYTEGLSEGMQKKAIEAAKTMLIKKYPTDDISEITGLPLEKVMELQKDLLVKAK